MLKVCYMPATSASLSSLLFLRWPLTVLMKQTRQAVCALSSLYYLDVYVPNNTYQFQTIPNKLCIGQYGLASVGIGWYQLVSVGISWYHLGSLGITWYQQYIEYLCQYNSSIIIVSFKYGSDGFLSVWYNHSTNSVNFQNTFDAEFNAISHFHPSLLFECKTGEPSQVDPCIDLKGRLPNGLGLKYLSSTNALAYPATVWMEQHILDTNARKQLS